MSITTILDRKGHAVVTVPPDATVREAVALLAGERLGALVVSTDGETLEGIISERDIVAGLAERGAELLDEAVGSIMTTEVTTCHPGAAVNHVMAEMTHRRIRHLPVVDEGRLSGIISIGDVVKHRIDELELETASLQEYVLGRGY